MKTLLLPMPKRVSYYLLVLTLLVFNACKTNDPGEDIPEYLVEADLLQEFTREQLVTLATGNDVQSPIIAGLIKNGAKAYRISYKTQNVDGTPILASGAIILPNSTNSASIISYQHGTITSSEAAPSAFGAGSEAATLGAVFGGLGYIIVMPDYIGYGASKNFPHPYEHRASLASASLDMLRAAKEFISREQSVNWNKNVYLAGYSEGGFATLSLQKKIEEEASGEFTLKASACGAGAYNKTAFMKHLVNENTHGVASFNRSYLWVLLTYNRVYNVNKPASYYFKEPYAAQITANGENALLGVSFNTTLTDAFRSAVNSGTDKSFTDAIADNDIYNWKPNTPTLLGHGDADQFVFYFNTQTAYDAMVAKGATKVVLERFVGKDHGTAVPPFLEKAFLFFLQNQ